MTEKTRSEENPRRSTDYQPSLKYRLLWWFGLLLLAMFITVPDPNAITAAYLFPWGLLGILGLWDDVDSPYGKLLLASPYLLYVIHLIMFLTLRSKKYFYILLWILIAMLALNIAGCRMMLDGVKDLH